MRDHAQPFWDDMIGIMLNLAEAQLKIGLSVVIDSVFMGDDRNAARQIAARHNARFRAIYTFVSDENLWRERVIHRIETAPPEDEPATWERIQVQRQSFQAWQPNEALFVDALESLENNFKKVIHFIST